MAPHSSTLAWKIPWTKEPGRLQSMGSLRVGHDFIFTFCFHALEKEMATHSSVLAWRIPGMGEPVGLPSMGSHRVGQDWSDLVVVVVVFSDNSHLLAFSLSPLWIPNKSKLGHQLNSYSYLENDKKVSYHLQHLWNRPCDLKIVGIFHASDPTHRLPLW